jgi:hypothetical protein
MFQSIKKSKDFARIYCEMPRQSQGHKFEGLYSIFPQEIEVEYDYDDTWEPILEEGTKYIGQILSPTLIPQYPDDRIFLTPSGAGIWYNTGSDFFQITNKKYKNAQELWDEITDFLLNA